MPVQTRSPRIKAPVISDPDNVPVEALSTNDYSKILKFINKSKFTFTDVDNENNKGLVHKCNSKHKCANLTPSDSFHSSLTHGKYVTKCNEKLSLRNYLGLGEMTMVYLFLA